MHKHHHHDMAPTTGSDRLDLLEKRLEEQAEEIHELKAQLNGGAAPSQVTSTQFEALQNQVYEQTAATAAAAKTQGKVTFVTSEPARTRNRVRCFRRQMESGRGRRSWT